MYGNGQVWWGVGKSMGTAIDRLRQHVGSSEPVVVFTPQKSRAKGGDGQVVVWRNYLVGSTGHSIPPHALVLSSAFTSGGKRKTNYYALICHCSIPLAEVAGGSFDDGMYRNLGSAKHNVGHSRVTAVVERKAGEPQGLGNNYEIHIRAILVDPYFVKLTNPRQLTDTERDRTDDAGRRTLGRDEWFELVRTIRQNA